jgi:RNA polymerase sigma-70 factor (ECF subfamily)
MGYELVVMGGGREVAGVAADSNSESAGPPLFGSTLAFSVFFEREYRSVVSLAAVLSGSRLVAEDLAQEAFAAAHRRWSEVSGYDRPEAWVRRVVANLAASWVRRRWREARAIARLGQQPGPGMQALEPEDEEFWAAVRSLPKRQAQCIALFYLDDRSVPQIAEILNIAESTVRVHLHQGRLTLARRLGEDAETDQ